MQKMIDDRTKTKRSSITPNKRFQVLQRDAFRCQYCGKTAQEGATLEIDHVIPVSKGGNNHIGNLITSCIECNRGKSATHVLPHLEVTKKYYENKENETIDEIHYKQLDKVQKQSTTDLNSWIDAEARRRLAELEQEAKNRNVSLKKIAIEKGLV